MVVDFCSFTVFCIFYPIIWFFSIVRVPWNILSVELAPYKCIDQMQYQLAKLYSIA